MRFLGRFEHQMDERGRVSLPSAFRSREEGDRFVLMQFGDPFLTLFPDEVWTGVQERLLQFRRSGKAAANQVRDLTSRAIDLSSDRQGRILIPAWLKDAAQLGSKVLMIGNLDRIEVWDPVIYHEVTSGGAEELDQFAAQIFG